jgi:hypothetical protein
MRKTYIHKGYGKKWNIIRQRGITRRYGHAFAVATIKDGWAGTRRERGERGYPQPTVNGRLFKVLSMAGTLSITDTLIVAQIAGRNQEIWI